MNKNLNIDIRAIAKKLFIAMWILFVIMLVVLYFAPGSETGLIPSPLLLVIILAPFSLVLSVALFALSRLSDTTGRMAAILSIICNIILVCFIGLMIFMGVWALLS